MRDVPPIIGFLTFFLMGLIGVGLGHITADTSLRKEAIRAGVAYYTNDASGKAQFKWKEAK